MKKLKSRRRIENLFKRLWGSVSPRRYKRAREEILLAAEFLIGNTTVRIELVPLFDALLRLKQLTRKEYADITARLAASL